MEKISLTKITTALVGIIVLTSACVGNKPAQDLANAPEPTPTLIAVGSTMDKPVPLGYDIILEDIVISLSEINRPANGIVAESDKETPTPENGQEYLLVRITNQCVIPGLENCFIGNSDYQLIDTSGNLVIPVSSLSGAEGFFTFGEFSSGTSNKGYLAFLVDKDVDYTFLTYQTFQGDNVYLALAY